MKKAILISIGLFFLNSTVQAQAVRSNVLNPDHAGKIFRNPINKKNKPVGSPYLQQAFHGATVEDLNIKAFMRYNVFNDEFEFISQKNDTLILDKIEDFGKITFITTNKKYRLIAYTNSKNSLTNGYLIELYSKSNYTLFKKENISFTEEKVAKTTLEVGMPAKYTKIDDTYFLRMPNGNTTEFPDGKKALSKLFPDKKQAIETFVKTNKIDFDNVADLVKVVDFLATL